MKTQLKIEIKPLEFDCKGLHCHSHHEDKPETTYKYHCKCCIKKAKETVKALEEKEIG